MNRLPHGRGLRRHGLSVLAAILVFAALPARAAQPAQSGPYQEYVIQRGDTIYHLAQRYLLDHNRWEALRRLNKVSQPTRLRPGQILRVPIDWLRTVPVHAQIVSLVGDVSLRRTSGDRRPEPGMRLEEGDTVLTGADGYLTLKLDDGSTVTIQEKSVFRAAKLRQRELGGSRDHEFALERGATENRISPRKRDDRFEIRTPLATTAVRGTEFRLGYADDIRRARTEVLEGNVAVTSGNTESAVAAGSGVVVDTSLAAQLAPLLPAPELSGVAQLHERVVMRVQFPAVPGAESYRVQLARDADFREIISGTTTQTPLTRFTDVADGTYHLRARGIDRLGLEGRDATRIIALKARPEPPFITGPQHEGTLRAEVVGFGWSANREAAHYRFQLADEPTLAKPLFARDDLTETRVVPDVRLVPGEYYWRVASVRADGDRGPFGDVQRFRLRAVPANPEPPALEKDGLGLRWPGEPGQTFQLQVARDDRFDNIVSDLDKLVEPAVKLPRPAAGAYYFRVRATDPDGFVGPYTATQRLEVPPPPPEPAKPWWLLFLLLLPLL